VAAVVAEGGGGAGAAGTDTVTAAAGADALPASSIGAEWRQRPSRDRGGGGRSCCHPELRQGKGASDRCKRRMARWPCPSNLFLSLLCTLSLYLLLSGRGLLRARARVAKLTKEFGPAGRPRGHKVTNQ
jgi:hypothetical protein